jgi:hypothetical protein
MAAIIIIQFNQKQNSRSYNFFDSRDECIEYIFRLYESSKKEELQVITFEKIFEFLYSLFDFSYFEKLENKNVYQPYGKDYFITMMYDFIKNKIE